MVKTSLKQSMRHQWLNFNFAKLWEYFLCGKKTKVIIYSTILLPELPSSTILGSTTTRVHAFTRTQHNQCCFRSEDSVRMHRGTLQPNKRFWVWRRFSCVTVKNILICVLKMNEGLTGLERHRIFILGELSVYILQEKKQLYLIWK